MFFLGVREEMWSILRFLQRLGLWRRRALREIQRQVTISTGLRQVHNWRVTPHYPRVMAGVRNRYRYMSRKEETTQRHFRHTRRPIYGPGYQDPGNAQWYPYFYTPGF